MEVTDEYESRLPFNYQQLEAETPRSWNGDFDRRFAFSRQTSFRDPPQTPVSVISNASVKPHLLSRTMSTIDIAPAPSLPASDTIWAEDEIGEKFSVWSLLLAFKSGSRQMKRLFVLIALNVAYSTAEFSIGLISGRVGLVSDAFHLTFGCGLLTFSLFAMSVSRRRPDRAYTYGYERLEVLSAFTNALFLLFMSFSLAVEALHAYTQDESEHKHYLIVSAVTNLLVNIIGIWFFRNYARVNLVYRRAEDMNYHSVCLHVISDSVRSAGLILASWLLALGVNNGEVLCLGLTSVTVFMLGMPLLRTTGAILLQMAPFTIPSSALSKCRRQVDSLEDVAELSEARFWEFVPGHVVGSLVLQLKKGVDDRRISGFVHDLYHELGVQDLTVQMNSV